MSAAGSPSPEIEDRESPKQQPEAIRYLNPLPSDPEETKREGDARRAIALRLVWEYLALLVLSAVIPIVPYWLWSGPTPDADKVTAIREMSAPLAAGVSSVTGVIGFVLGYCFKSEEGKRE
jgi:hypothetical protein